MALTLLQQLINQIIIWSIALSSGVVGALIITSLTQLAREHFPHFQFLT